MRQWFQATWTKRFNMRHRQWGRLFGDRYKAKPVEEGEYLGVLLDYIHLNPVRAGLVTRQSGIEAYRWSSLVDYLAPVYKRRSWVSVMVALLVRQRGLASNTWLSERLGMGAPSAVSRTIANARRKMEVDTVMNKAFEKLLHECSNG